jgi:hypothetical protein
VNADERQEIAASVAAHAELGPRYDGAVAEGLVERIGEEIDRRVDARLRGMGQHGLGQHGATRQNGMSPGQQIVPPGYQGGQQQQAMPAPAADAPPTAPVPAPAPEIRRGSGVTGMILGLGSMGLGVGATSVVVAHHVTASAAVIMVLLIWAAIAVINIAHAQRR